jgi:hypothetical protein
MYLFGQLKIMELIICGVISLLKMTLPLVPGIRNMLYIQKVVQILKYAWIFDRILNMSHVRKCRCEWRKYYQHNVYVTLPPYYLILKSSLGRHKESLRIRQF